MRSSILSFFIFFVCCLPPTAPSSPAQLDRHTLAQNVLDSSGVLVREVVDGSGIYGSVCTGFFWRDFFITAAHCIPEGSVDVKLVTYRNYIRTGGLRQPISAFVGEVNEQSDIAILAPLEMVEHSSLELATENVQLLDEVFAVGCPHHYDFSFFEGSVSNPYRLRVAPPGVWTQVDLMIKPGSSGGPVVNSDGQLIGISLFYRDSRIGGVLHLSKLREFLSTYL